MVSISFRSVLACMAMLVLSPAALQAFHGLFLPSYGARQAGMGGAFLAIGGSVMDLQNNPSGLMKLEDPLFEAGIALNQATIDYEDRTFSSSDGLYFENHNRFKPVSPLPYAGYATPVGDRFAFGVALYAQGGGGAEVDGIFRRASAESTANGEVHSSAIVSEDLKFRFLHAKLTVGGAMSMGRLHLGLAADISYGTNRLDRTLQVLSNESDNDPLSYIRAPGGFHYRSDPAYTPSGKLGISYDWTPEWTTSYSYSAASYLPLNGLMRADSTDIIKLGSSQVRRTLSWPDRHSIGIGYQKGSVTVAVDMHYIPWSRHFDRMTFQMDRPMITTPFGITAPSLIWNLRWKDQPVFAVGMEYRVSSLAYRIGMSYGATPIPAEGLSPFLGSTTEYHINLGVGYSLEKVTLDVALEYAPGRRIEGSPFSDWALSREVQGAVFQFIRSTSTKGIYMGLRYKI